MIREQPDPDFSCPGHVPQRQLRETHLPIRDSTLAPRTRGWADRLPGQRIIAQAAAWYRARTRHSDMQAVTLQQITDYEAPS